MKSSPSQSGLLSTDGVGARLRAGDTIGWLLLFTIATYVAGRPELTPVVPGTELRLIWFPFALLNIALLLRPRSEAPLYAVIYAAISLAPQDHSGHLDFAVARVGLEIVQAIVVVYLFHEPFRYFLNYPAKVVLYLLGVLGIFALGAFATVSAAQLLAADSSVLVQEMGGNPTLAWRHWWLGNACAFLTVAGPATYLIMLRRSLIAELRRNHDEAKALAVISVSLFLSGLLLLPAYDTPLMHVPADIHLALMLIPAPIAFAMAARFRGLGTCVALLILAPLAMISAGGPHAGAHWSGLPPMATPLHTFLIVTAVGCNVISAITHRLRRAVDETIAASQAKSRFVAMLNHELRTPLNAILGFSELIRLKDIQDMDEAIGPIENIHASGQRLLAMIEGLLNQADQGASAFALNKQPVRLDFVLASVVGELQPDFDRLGGRVILSASDLMVEADPLALKQMLLVLLSYPLRYASPDTAVFVSAEALGTDTIVEIRSKGLTDSDADDRDKIELQLVRALALAHGARLHVTQSSQTERLARLTFFATRAAP